MLFKKASEYFDKIEEASSRLVMTDYLAELFEEMPKEDAKKIVYLIMVFLMKNDIFLQTTKVPLFLLNRNVLAS